MKSKASKLMKIKEGKSNMLILDFSKIKSIISNDDLDTIAELSMNGFEVNSVGLDSIPVPAECYVYFDISKKELILDGHVDTNGFGSCICRVPLKEAGSVYEISLVPRSNKSVKDLIALLTKYSISVA